MNVSEYFFFPRPLLWVMIKKFKEENNFTDLLADFLLKNRQKISIHLWCFKQLRFFHDYNFIFIYDSFNVLTKSIFISSDYWQRPCVTKSLYYVSCKQLIKPQIYSIHTLNQISNLDWKLTLYLYLKRNVIW